MKKLPLISIITIALNQEKTIEKTIRSVVNQVYKNIEFLIIDGKSNDGTVNIIKKYQNNINYWVSEPDKGIYEAMNKGVKESSGDYLYFLNAGDWLHDNKVIRDIAYELKKRPVDLLYGKSIRLYEGYQALKVNKFNEKTLRRGIIPSHQGSFFKVNTFKKIGTYNESFRSAGDFDFYCRLWQVGCKGKFIDREIAYVASGGLSSQKIVSHPEAYRVIKKYFGIGSARRFALEKTLLEQGTKRILLSMGLKNLYEFLAKKANQRKS